MAEQQQAVSIILAAGRGSRMKGFEGSKTLLPLVPRRTPFAGERPILQEIVANLPEGPKVAVVHHDKAAVIQAAQDLGLAFCEQPVLNGTGGALLAAAPFLGAQHLEPVIVTMGDVPLVRPATFQALLRRLKSHPLVVLGFMPASRRQYGLLETDADSVRRIIEWKYWKDYSSVRLQQLKICNAGIYAARRSALLPFLSSLVSLPHVVRKEMDGRPRTLKEFFITDLVQLVTAAGMRVGLHVVEDETEVLGVDDTAALQRAQAIYRARARES